MWYVMMAVFQNGVKSLKMLDYRGSDVFSLA